MIGYIEIALTRGQVATIDAADYPLVEGRSWQARPRRDGKGFYAVSNGLRMHRLLCGVSDKRIVDHRDGDGLNNRRANLRIGTQSQNCINRRTTPGPHLRGARPQKGKWRSQIRVGKTMRSLGYYDTEQEAHDAFVVASREMHGDWQPLPEPPLYYEMGPSRG